MEKYSFEKAENESVKIGKFAEKIKKGRMGRGEDKGGPTGDDYEEANGWVEEEKNNKKAGDTLKNLKNIDLSTPEGRISVAQMYERKCSKIKVPIFKGPKPGNRDLNAVIENSVVWRGGIPLVSKETLLKDTRLIASFFGHALVKRPWDMQVFILGRESDLKKDQKEMLTGKAETASRLMFANVLAYSGAVSSEALNGCLAKNFLIGLHSDINSGKISEDQARKHPNYISAEDLALKADKQQNTWSDILFKMFSSYIHNGTFKIPPVAMESRIREAIIKKCEEINIFADKSGKIVKKLTDSKVAESVSSFSSCPELEAEIRAWIKYIDFFQPILEKYNSMMTYHSADAKK